jgi:hypothetical protein
MVYRITCSECGKQLWTRDRRRVICKSLECKHKRDARINKFHRQNVKEKITTTKCNWCGHPIATGPKVEENGKQLHAECYRQKAGLKKPLRQAVLKFDGGNRVLPPKPVIIHARGMELVRGVVANIFIGLQE